MRYSRIASADCRKPLMNTCVLCLMFAWTGAFDQSAGSNQPTRQPLSQKSNPERLAGRACTIREKPVNLTPEQLAATPYLPPSGTSDPPRPRRCRLGSSQLLDRIDHESGHVHAPRADATTRSLPPSPGLLPQNHRPPGGRVGCPVAVARCINNR